MFFPPYLVSVGTSSPTQSTGSSILPRLPGGRDAFTAENLQNIGIQPVTNIDTGTLINEIIAYAIILAGFLSILFMLWGGIQYIVSGGKEDKVKKATHTIRYAIIGLVVTILSVSVINLIGQIFNLDLANYVSFDHILQIINNLFSGRR